MSKSLLHVVGLTALSLGLIASASTVFAAESAPATPPAPVESLPLRVVVTQVQGMVEVRTAEDQPWQKAQVGMELGAGADFRTGPRSVVRFRIPPDQTITLDRLGTVRVMQAVKEAGKMKTDLGMRYGRTRLDIEATGGSDHEATIRTPTATLAIRGTIAVAFDQGFYEPSFTSLEHEFLVRKFNGKTTSVGGTTDATMSEDDESAGWYAWRQSASTTGPTRAYTDEELRFFDDAPEYVGNYLRTVGFFDFRENSSLQSVKVRIDQIPLPDLVTNVRNFPVRIFDNGLEDGDVVRVLLNNNVLSNNLTLTNSGQTFVLNLKNGYNDLRLVNVSMGNDGVPNNIGTTNTGAIELPVGGQLKPFEMTTIGQSQQTLIVLIPDSNSNPQPTSSRRKK